VSFTLVTNDDGVDSPALPPLARALSARGRVEVAAPDVERSWIGKAITRYDDISVKQVERDGVEMMSVGGYPADAVQLGVHRLFGEKAAMVVSGVNIGANFGSGYVIGSGTVGAATEGAIAAIPSFAFSAVSVGHFQQWASHMRTPASIPDWERYAQVSVSIVDEVMAAGFPDEVDVISVNMPADAHVSMPRKVTHIARTRYGPLFQQLGPGVWKHDWVADTEVYADWEGSDIQAVEDGVISVTPLRVSAIGVASEVLSQLWP